MTDIDNIIRQLEQERTAIEKALAALRELGGSAAAPKRRGRPKGTKNAPMTEGRRRQIEAMRRYWAEKRAAKKAASKEAA